ncbi:hypothetical protein BDZ89DRAFT_588997 [Hymenopellis radicata]|nr:hypothetical protein BDZ89DRAFT_588997 [Hymenopellis radicata]
MFGFSLFVLSLSSFAAAQYGYGDTGATTAAATSATTAAAAVVPSAPPNTNGHINVGRRECRRHVQIPATELHCPNSTFVTFFFPNSDITHSVTQSSFADPCTYLVANSTANTPAGFDSGLTSSKQFTIQIMDDTKPIWFHCKQVTHCGMGMVGSINAQASGNTFDKFQSAAQALGSSAPTETDSGPVTGGVNGVATATPAATVSASSSSSSSSGSGTNGAAALSVWVSSTFAILFSGMMGVLMA